MIDMHGPDEVPVLHVPHIKQPQRYKLNEIKEDRPFATPEAAERKLLELANAIEADHAGRVSVAIINKQFRDAGGSYEEYRAAVKAAIAHGWITMHPSGGYLSFTQAGADLFA